MICIYEYFTVVTGDEENRAQQGLMSVNPRRRNDQRQNQQEQVRLGIPVTIL